MPHRCSWQLMIVTSLRCWLPIFCIEKVTNILKIVIKIMILQQNISSNITVTTSLNQVKLFHLSFFVGEFDGVWSFIGDHKMICLNILNELVVLKIAWIWKIEIIQQHLSSILPPVNQWSSMYSFMQGHSPLDFLPGKSLYLPSLSLYFHRKFSQIFLIKYSSQL